MKYLFGRLLIMIYHYEEYYWDYSSQESLNKATTQTLYTYYTTIIEL